MLKILVFILSIYAFGKTIGYGIYEWKQEKNKVGAITIYSLACFFIITINLIMNIRY